MIYYARTPYGKPWSPTSACQLMSEHEQGVAERAENHAASFNSSEWGRLLGMWHDLGKYRPAFQACLRGDGGPTCHSIVGAQLARSREPREFHYLALALPIAGHHGGMTDPAALLQQIKEEKENIAFLEEAMLHAPANILAMSIPDLPVRFTDCSIDLLRRKRNYELWVRFLFSALVDADRLDAEKFVNQEKHAKRTQDAVIPVLRERLDAYIDAFAAKAADSSVNAARRTILSACRASADNPPGIFSLTVPTGGGKTLSGLSFAMRHAEHHSLRRVIVVIPYTSIIEQNARVYAEALGVENVLEHHSNLDLEQKRKKIGQEITTRHELASENWDMPVVVTTTVQFFESLFSNKASRCRKLHNIAKSVIILDEVQMLPVEFLKPIVEGLDELAKNYGCSVVLSTATPPSLRERPGVGGHGGFRGLSGITNIIADPAGLARTLRRVEYDWSRAMGPAVEWPMLAEELAGHPRVLAITHRRDDARLLAREVKVRRPDEPFFHLSALMCPAHRSVVMSAVRATLGRPGICRVVSTQLSQTGQDFSFPVVYCPTAGLDSIVQPGGRCNREKELPGLGRVVVYRAPTKPPSLMLCKALSQTESLLKEHGGSINMEDPAILERFFRGLYGISETDEKSIQALRSKLNFPETAKKFKLIEETQSLVVPYGDVDKRLARLVKEGPNRHTMRALQPFLVNVYAKTWEKLLQAKAIEEVKTLRDSEDGIGVFTLAASHGHLYSSEFGLVVEDEEL